MDERAAAYFFEELLSSDESSDEENNIRDRGPLELRPRIRNYVKDVVDAFRDAEFREHFRMYRTTFNYLLNILEHRISPEDGGVAGRNPVPVKEQLLFTIWYFATPDAYRSICCRFNLGKATGLRCVRRVTNAILEVAPTFITWPTDEYSQVVMNAFNIMGFPQTMGAVDGSYIPIPQPKEHGISYICRKNFAAIILQGVCDHRMLFSHCYVGEVGSTHDARVLKRSDLWEYLTSSRNEKFPQDSHLIGDKAYPCLQSLLVPYRDNGHLNNRQKEFNFRLSAARSVIERAFALLKKRFRKLKHFDIKDIPWVCKYIVACCVLHNICILQNDILHLDVNDIEEDVQLEPLDDVLHTALARMGQRKRDYIMELMPE